MRRHQFLGALCLFFTMAGLACGIDGRDEQAAFDVTLGRCERVLPAGSLDLDRGCLLGVCLGDRARDIEAQLGRPLDMRAAGDSFFAAALDDDALAGQPPRPRWAVFSAAANGGPPTGDAVAVAVRAGGGAGRAATDEGLGLGSTVGCFVEDLGLPERLLLTRRGDEASLSPHEARWTTAAGNVVRLELELSEDGRAVAVTWLTVAKPGLGGWLN